MLDELLKNKKMLYIIFAVIILIIVIIGVASCEAGGDGTSTIGFKKDSWEKIENAMVEAAEEYYSAYPNYMPDEGETTEVSVTTLVAKGYMYELSEYVSEGITCTGKVSLTNYNNEYTYTPSLDCGDAYCAVALYETIIQKYEDKDMVYVEGSDVVSYDETTQQEGLYQTEDQSEYYFRGDIEDNYVLIGENTWRIMKIDSNDYVYLILDDYFANRGYWDNSYNIDTEAKDGINDYNISVLRENIESALDNDKLIPIEIASKLVKTRWCIGKRTDDDTTKDGSTECSVLSEESYIGAISVYEYLRSSVDVNCINTLSKSCVNHNYLDFSSYWTITANADTSNQTYSISYANGVSKTKAKLQNYIKYVIVLNKTTIMTGGDGSEKEPYTIK